MGHQRMLGLPTSRKWTKVVEALTSGADVAEVARLSADAAAEALGRARSTPALAYSLDLLARMPLAARDPGYLAALARLGLNLDHAPTLVELTAAVLDRLETRTRKESDWTASDVPVFARLAATEALSALIAPQLPGLFGANPGDVRAALGRFSSGQQFAVLAREFFSRFLYRTLDYYLSRALADQMGPGKRLSDVADRFAFENALATHCKEATLIIRDHASGWYGKHVYQAADLSDRVVADYADYSLQKILAELRKRQDG